MRSLLATVILSTTFSSVLSATISSRDSSLLCGAHGWSKGTNSFWSDEHSADFASCYSSCQSQNCVSFAYYNPNATANGECQLYNVAASANFSPDNSSSYIFYDIACLPQSQAQQCNIVGYDKLQSTAEFTASDVSACVKNCTAGFSAGSCVSYGFGNGKCELYMYNVGNNVTPDPASPYVFSDITCNVNVTQTATVTVTVTYTNTHTAVPTTCPTQCPLQ